MSPGWSKIRGAHTDAYRTVWVHVYELAPGSTTHAGAVRRALHVRLPRRTVERALNIVAAAGFLQRITGGARVVYRRRPLPRYLTVEWLTRAPNSAGLIRATNILDGLESAGYLQATKKGYRHAD